MAIVERRRSVIGMREARSTLPQIVASLEENPARAYEVMRYQERAAIILSPEAFERLIDAAEEALDERDAEEALTNDSLGSFADYHARRIARRQTEA